MTVNVILERQQQLQILQAVVQEFQEQHANVAEVTQDTEQAAWRVQIRGGTKDPLVVWLRPNERAVSFETYLAPWPQHNAYEVFEYLLRASRRLDLVRVAIGDEDALFLFGEIQWQDLQSPSASDRLDQMIGAMARFADELYSVVVPLGFEPFGLHTAPKS